MREVYNGYNEKILTGKELKTFFPDKFLNIGNHRQDAILDVTIQEYLNSIKIDDNETYRIFYNNNFCKIMNNNDKNIDFIKYVCLENTIYSNRHLNRNINCKLCGSKMFYNTGKFGPFWSCCNYPKCKGSKKIWILGYINSLNNFKPCNIPEKE